MTVKANKIYKKIQVLPDIHAPWVDWDALKLAKKWHQKHQPDLVIQLGDLWDQKIWSRWPSDPDDFGPSEEYAEAKSCLERLNKWFPNMVILRGNHDERIKKRAQEAGIPVEMFLDVNQSVRFSGWTWVDRGEFLKVNTPRGPVLFMHGDEQGGTVAAKSRMNGISVVQGHTHKASIIYTKIIERHIFGAEMGCLMDVNSKAARYAQANPVGVSVGFGVIKNGVPYFVSCENGAKV